MADEMADSEGTGATAPRAHPHPNSHEAMRRLRGGTGGQR